MLRGMGRSARRNLETGSVQPGRGLGLAPADLLSVSLAGELAIGRDPKFPLTYFHPGRLALSPSAGAHRAKSLTSYRPPLHARRPRAGGGARGKWRIPVELPLGRVWYSGVAGRDPISTSVYRRTETASRSGMVT